MNEQKTVRLRDRADYGCSRIIVRQREQQEDVALTTEGQDFVLYVRRGSITQRTEFAFNVLLSKLRAYRDLTDEEWDALEAEIAEIRAAGGVQR